MNRSTDSVSYAHWSEFPWREDARTLFLEWVKRAEAKDVLEVGSGANPTLTAEDVVSMGLRYVTNDVDAAELAKAGPEFQQLCADGSVPAAYPVNAYDLVVSKMVNEHVPDAGVYFKNIFDSLRPGGVTLHLYAALGSLPFLANKLVPELVSSAMLRVAHPWNRDDRHNKFPAHYSWAVGPTETAISRYEEIGFEVEQYRGFFGHGYYNRMPGIREVADFKARKLVEHPHPRLCSYVQLVLRKPVAD